MLHVVEHTIIDSVRLIPFLFLTYAAMEYLEHRAGGKAEAAVRRAGKWGPLIGSLLGVVPQCGFSAAASNFYAGRVISLGSLLAIYLSTSDEMLPILLSERVEPALIVRILLIKVGIGMVAGFLVDWAVRKKKDGGVQERISVDGEMQEQISMDGEMREQSSMDGGEPEQIPPDDASHDCGQENCHCRKGILYAAALHTLQITFFILLITFGLELLLHFGGEDILSELLLNRPLIGPLIASLVGLIPNCVGSVIVTQLYLEGVLTFGSMLAGLLSGTGVGILILCRVNHHKKENAAILGLVYGIGALTGILLG